MKSSSLKQKSLFGVDSSAWSGSSAGSGSVVVLSATSIAVILSSVSMVASSVVGSSSPI